MIINYESSSRLCQATCAALVVSSVSSLGRDHLYVAMSYPLMIRSGCSALCKCLAEMTDHLLALVASWVSDIDLCARL